MTSKNKNPKIEALIRKLVPGLIALLIRLIRLTCRLRVTDHAGLFNGKQALPVIMISWHNRLLFLPTVFPRSFCRQIAILASLSRDGEYAAAFCRQFGLQAVRGSSSRGGAAALRTLRQTLKAGTSTSLTPDGPRGPRYCVHPGAIFLAQTSGYPVVPISLNSPRHWELHGWDRTQIPKPFSRLELVIGTPLTIPRKLPADQKDQQAERVRQALLEITQD
jgi:lysophospholipid acyltransferase (LPLAT)-like uncharacterized protein